MICGGAENTCREQQSIATLDMLNELEKMEHGDDEDNILCILISSAVSLIEYARNPWQECWRCLDSDLTQ